MLTSKTELASNKKLLEVLSAFSFNLYYMKEKDISLSDFLFRIKVYTSNSHEIIPISLIWKTHYKKNIMFRHRSGAQKAGINERERYEHDKSLLPLLKPVKQLK